MSTETTAPVGDPSSALDLLFIIDPIASLLAGHDTSVALMEAAQARGHRVLVTTAAELGFREGSPIARCTPVTVRPAVLKDGHWVAEPDWYALGEPAERCLNELDAILMRTDPPIDGDYLRATYLLDLVDSGRVLVLNSPTGLREANEKLFGLRAFDLMPPTVVSADRDAIRACVQRWGKGVLKPTDAMAGRGIMVLQPGDPNLSSILDTATDRGRTHVVVQQWIAAAPDAGDRRIIVLDGQPLGSVRRVAVGEDFRCNMAAGADALADSITAADRVLCERVAPLLAQYGLYLVGLDVIGDWLTEVNVTSPTGVREIDALTGSHLSLDIVEWIERSCPRGLRQRESTP